MLPPVQLLHICNETIVVNITYQFIQAPNYTYFACSSGLTPHIITGPFLAQNDCVLVLLLPKLIRSAEELLSFDDKGFALSRPKCELITSITLAIVLGLGKGIVSLITSNHQYNHLAFAIDKDVCELKESLKYLTEFVASLAEVVQQNHLGLDLAMAILKEEGVYVLP